MQKVRKQMAGACWRYHDAQENESGRGLPQSKTPRKSWRFSTTRQRFGVRQFSAAFIRPWLALVKRLLAKARQFRRRLGKGALL
jgi:hypothetical protein